ncbi:MAG: alpha/beta fold hydrolase, partial [Leptodesmis sp.]|uniref:alpha/beta fold hydrolase n=1 Tax=Leptodesmis sp. TaxID=3100501 RepID=UPI003D0D1571
MPTIDISGIPHSYDLTPATRSPDVLVFIHGWLLSRQYWHPLIDQLASTYQCLAYDLRGFGGSCLPAGVQDVLPLVSYSLAS